MSWVDGNLGSKLTMKYPACYLEGKGAHGEMLSLAYTSKDQEISAGARMIHNAPQTTSKVISKSLANENGKVNYRGELQINKTAKDARAFIQCDTIILDEKAESNSYPNLKIKENSAKVEHEASASKLEDKKLQYLRSRGLTFSEAKDLIIKGFMEPVIQELPIEYAIEFNQLIEKSIL